MAIASRMGRMALGGVEHHNNFGIFQAMLAKFKDGYSSVVGEGSPPLQGRLPNTSRFCSSLPGASAGLYSQLADWRPCEKGYLL